MFEASVALTRLILMEAVIRRAEVAATVDITATGATTTTKQQQQQQQQQKQQQQKQQQQ